MLLTNGRLSHGNQNNVEPVSLRATINRDLAALRSVLTKAFEWGVLKTRPLERFKPLDVDISPTVRCLSPDEETRLREALRAREARIRTKRDTANQWRRERGREEYPSLDNSPYADHFMPMVLLSLNTGLRRGEIFNLCVAYISTYPIEHLLLLPANSKNGNTRHVPFNDEAFKVLDQPEIHVTSTLV